MTAPFQRQTAEKDERTSSLNRLSLDLARVQEKGVVEALLFLDFYLAGNWAIPAVRGANDIALVT